MCVCVLQDFKEELECMVKEQSSKGSNSSGLLGHITQLIISNTLSNTGVYSPCSECTHTFNDTLYIPTDDYVLLLWSTDGKQVILYVIS